MYIIHSAFYHIKMNKFLLKLHLQNSKTFKSKTMFVDKMCINALLKKKVPISIPFSFNN
jgi:hypothetical protein